jgi:hypothetical protein
MTRLTDWDIRFPHIIDAARRKPFEWGAHDCCMWAANVVQELTGIDYAQQYRGQYADETEALALLEAAGGIEAMLTNALGDRLPDVRQAQRGDVVLYAPVAERWCAMICTGISICGPASRGLEFFPLIVGHSAWRI